MLGMGYSSRTDFKNFFKPRLSAMPNLSYRISFARRVTVSTYGSSHQDFDFKRLSACSVNQCESDSPFAVAVAEYRT